MESWRKYAAEVYGTFVLVMIGTAAIVAAAVGGGRAIDVALAFGLALLVGLYTVGHISGGHFNPAVSLAMYLDRRLSITNLIGYWAAQLAGAVVASLALAWIVSRDAVAATVTTVNSAMVSDFMGFVTEALLTAMFVLIILVVTKRAAPGAYVAIALALAAVHFAGIPITGASVNPARSFGPALVSGEWQDIGVYIAGPAVGAVVAWVVFTVLLARDQQPNGIAGSR